MKIKIVKALLLVGSLRLLNVPLALFTSVILARGLGPEDYGQYAFILSFVTLAAIPFGSGIRKLVTRETASAAGEQAWPIVRGILVRGQQWAIFGALAVGVFAIGAEFGLNSFSNLPPWMIPLLASALILVGGMSAVRTGILQGLHFPFESRVPELLILPLGNLTLLFLLLQSGHLSKLTALASFQAASIAAWAAGVVLLARFLPKHVRHATPKYRTYEWLTSLSPFILLNFISLFNSQFLLFLTGLLSRSEEIASYKIAIAGASVVALPLNVVLSVVGASVTAAFKSGDTNALRRLYYHTTRSAFGLAVLVAVPMICWGSEIIRITYGADYVPAAAIPLSLLAVAQVVNAFFGPVGLMLTMSGHEKEALKGHIIGVALTAVAAVLLIPKFGAAGAAGSAIIGLLAWNLLVALKMRKILGVRPGLF